MSTLLFDQYGHPIKALVDPAQPEALFDAYGRPHVVVEDATGLDLAAANAIEVLHRRGIFLPCVYWSINTGQAGTGSGWALMNAYAVKTGTTANSNFAAAMELMLLRGAHFGVVNFDKSIKLSFLVERQNSDAQVVARWRLAAGFTWPIQEEDFLGHGLGIEVQDLALYGVSRGSGDSKASVNLNTSLVSAEAAFIEIVHYPGEKIEWYVNEALKGTQSTPTNIPSGTQSACKLGWSVKNGAAGGTDCYFVWGDFLGWIQR